MEDTDLKAPILGASRNGTGGGRLSRRSYSVKSLKKDFALRLPDKLRSAGDFDPESQTFSPDLSTISGLTKGEREYYERQINTMNSFEEVDSLVTSNDIDDEERKEQAKEDARHERAMKISNYANIILLAFKVYATIKSGSLAIAASTLDSLLDLMAGGILWFTHLAMKNINIYKYPIGKLRVQPVGIIIFAAVMATLGFQVLLQAAEELIKDEPSEKLSKSKLIWMCTIMISATVVKLALWIYCKNSENDIVRAYAKDHFFDVVTNVVGLAAALLADEFFWWIDPAGAIILALYTIINWSQTVFENAVSLVGQSASPEVLQKLTYLVMRHPKVKRIDTVRAYTFGVLYFVEVDIELPEELPLKEAHTIGESLQEKLEKLPEVERAFVHLDFECDHKPEHSVPSRLPNNQT
ncbi:metal tolerance protein 4-like isoform X2 [Quercus robur]|uniref:metal tolerance protein 4-like isoform X2 n=1 Tax=Quercus robur TaxID=38942 RepID=UPI0021625D7C|nr:metal tolerance protein 4-like isoform X2 [Quercus robur]